MTELNTTFARLRKAGALKLVVLSGLFTGVEEAKADLLVVGDGLDGRHPDPLFRR